MVVPQGTDTEPSAGPLSLRLTPEDDTTVAAALAGELDLRTADRLDDLGELLIGAGFTAVRLDLAGVRAGDGEGAVAIERLRTRLRSAGMDVLSISA